MLDPDRLGAALAEAREAIAAAARDAGRDVPPELLLAGKYIAPAEVPMLLAAGVERLGENRLQDLQAKAAIAGGRLEFDFIGHLQRRKVVAVLSAVRLVHALDSVRLAETIATRAEGPTRVLVEINVADEDSKPGISLGDLDAFVADVSRHENLVLGGLMCMPPAAADAESSRPHFATARETASRLAERWTGRHDFSDLSMGTSQDFLVAAEEGATIVRVGRGLVEQARTSES